MEKQKVTVEFQNKFCDKLYNRVQHAEFNWLKKYCKDKNEVWAELIEAVDKAMYSVITEFFDNTEHKNDCMGSDLFFVNNSEPLVITAKDTKTEKEVLEEANENSPSYCMLKEFYGNKK